jgi:hypothetical protein
VNNPSEHTTEKAAIAAELETARVKLRKIFRSRRKPDRTPLIPCCVSLKSMRRVLRTAYDNVTPEDLHAMLWHAGVCWGEWQDLAYYAPCLLELAAVGGMPDGEMVYARLLTAANEGLSMSDRPEEEANRMTLDEQAAIKGFLVASLRSQIVSGPIHWPEPVMEALIYFLYSDGPLRELLEWWSETTIPEARANLCRFYADYQPPMRDPDECVLPLFNSHYDGPVSEHGLEAMMRFMEFERMEEYLADHILTWPRTAQEKMNFYPRAYSFLTTDREGSRLRFMSADFP